MKLIFLLSIVVSGWGATGGSKARDSFEKFLRSMTKSQAQSLFKSESDVLVQSKVISKFKVEDFKSTADSLTAIVRYDVVGEQSLDEKSHKMKTVKFATQTVEKQTYRMRLREGQWTFDRVPHPYPYILMK